MCRPLQEFGGIYCTHMRNEAEHVLDSLDESFRIGREMGVPVVISHHKVNGLANHGRSRETLAADRAADARRSRSAWIAIRTAPPRRLSADRASGRLAHGGDLVQATSGVCRERI